MEMDRKYQAATGTITDFDFDNTLIPYDPIISNQTLTITHVVGELRAVEIREDEIDPNTTLTRDEFSEILRRVIELSQT